MPFHPDIATRLPLLEGIPSLEAGLSEPLMRHRWRHLMLPGRASPG